MKIAQNKRDCLSIVLGFRVSGYSQARYVYNTLHYGRECSLHFKPATTLTQTLRIVRQTIRKHYAQMEAKNIAHWIKGYALNLSILGENVLFFDTQGKEIGDDISPLPYRNFSFETLYGGTDSFLKPNLPPNAKRQYIPRDDDYRKWRKSGVKTGIISSYVVGDSPKNATKADKTLRMLLKANDKIRHICVNGRLNDECEMSYLIYALDNAFDLRGFLCVLGAQFRQNAVLYSGNGLAFERVYMSGICRNEMLYEADLWHSSGNFNRQNYERLRAHFGGKYKVSQYADIFAIKGGEK